VNTNEYHFVSHWQVEATCGEVADVLSDPLTLTRWWPSVYLEVQELEPGGPRGVGRRVRALTRGWLPYTLRWEFVMVDTNYPYGFSIAASGDFDGLGVWTFRQLGKYVAITYDWRIRVEKPLIRTLSPLFKPMFAANHRWAMAQGEESLRLELARCRAKSVEALAAIPGPPPAVTYSAIAVLAGGAAAVAAAILLVARARRRAR
jgi:hypothetical protein